jgi:hypothetical protein
MAIVANFSVSQNSGTPSIISLHDDSTGTDLTITKRRIYLLQADGTYLVPVGTTTNYIEWAITDTANRTPLTTDLNVLLQDTALSINVQWLNAGNTVIETKTISYAFTSFGERFYYGLSQDLVGNSNLSASVFWYENKMKLRCELDSATQSISFASDIFTAQSCLNRASYLIKNSNYFF